jgi:hypothetical protein
MNLLNYPQLNKSQRAHKCCVQICPNPQLGKYTSLSLEGKTE